MAKLSSNKAELSDLKFTSRLPDDGALCSGIGKNELKVRSPYLPKNCNGHIEPATVPIAERTHWQYGTRSHNSDSRKMLGSVMLTATFEDGTMVNVRHAVIYDLLYG